jgi:long-subunit fatty acid transport protein
VLLLSVATVLAQAVAVPPSLIITNYDRLPVGQREGIEAGAFLARTNDAGANWYNPAGLGNSVETSLNAGANAYEWTKMGLEGFGTTQGRSRINTIGTLISVAIGKGTIKSDQWRLGFSITRPIVWQPSSIDFAFSPAANQVVSYASTVDFNVMIPGVSVAYAPGGVGSGRLRLGAGLGMAITSITQNQSISSRVTTATSASLTEQNFSTEGSTWHLQPSAGVQWNATSKVIVGGRIAAPGIRILGSSRLTLQTSQFTSPTSTDLVFRDDEATFDYKRPLEASAGLAYIARRGEIEFDVHYYGKLDSYELYASDSTGTLTTVDNAGTPTVTNPAFVPTANSARAVTNISIGANYKLSTSLRVHAGFASDASPVDDQAQSIFRKLDLSRFTTGLSLTGQRLAGSLGIGYSVGSGSREAIGATPGQTKLTVKTLNVLFGLSFAFGK